jgi:cytochrome c553
MTSIPETEITSREPIEITLPETSIIRQLFEASYGDEKNDNKTEIKEVEKTLSDDEYNQLMAMFLNQARQEQEQNKPENKIKRILKEKENERKRAQFKDIKPGFLL